jgi:hypothetical protein
VTSKIASAILTKITDTTSFTARDVAGFFPAVPFGILKDSIKELVEEKKVFTYGIKRGTFYSTNPNLNTDEKEDELNPLLISEVETFVLGRQEFSSSDLFSTFPGHQEHILRKILIFLRDEKKMIHLHGHGKSSIWSQHSELPDTSNEEEEIDQELTAKILDFAKLNMRWFKRSELDNLFEASAYDVRQALYGLMDDGEIQMRGEKRSTEYAYCEVIDTVDETEEGEQKADPVLKQNVLAHIEASRIVTIPQLIEKFDTARPNIVLALRELEEEGEIYHEGIKKTSKYIHKNVPTSAAESIAKEIREEKKDEERAIKKPVDELSSLLRCNSAVYIIFIDGTQKYELRCVNTLQGGTKTLFSSADAAEVCEQMLKLTKEIT